MFLLSLTLSSYDSPAVVEDNGVDVTIIKNGEHWIWVCSDGSWIYATKSTDQYKNGVLHMSTYIWDLEGCVPSPKKTVRGTVIGHETTARYLHNPSGKGILKEIHNN